MSIKKKALVKPRILKPRRPGLKNGMWNSFFSRGIGLNLAPRLPKTDFKNSSQTYPGWQNTARKWAGAMTEKWHDRTEKWHDTRLGKNLASDQFSTWLRSDKKASEFRPGFDRYEKALKRDFNKAAGIDGNAIVFRGMPSPSQGGTVDKSPISVTKRLGIAAEYANNGFRPGNRRGHVVVALLLPPGTKILPLGSTDAEYLLPPGRITPAPGHRPRRVTRMETDRGDANLTYVDRLHAFIQYHVENPNLLSRIQTYRSVVQKPNVNKIEVTVVPAVFTPDPGWTGRRVLQRTLRSTR